jgi:GT2 family glycosyltransferase
MKLSVVLVNHNNCALLEQSLNSLLSAVKDIESELFVVDNASTDRSREMLENTFPTVEVIANDTDLGLAKANNQALRLCTGEYVLLVRPDTFCNSGSLEKMMAFMDSHGDTGGMGVRMLTHQGRFLPESMHGLTKQWTYFLKLIGFAKNLPKTRLYDRNRKEWVEEFAIAEVDLLNGSCMMLRKSVLNETGLFDERFFMFGYDIDLSYRIRLAGFKNYYFPKTYIINLNCLNLPQFTWSYIKNFYGAMFIFAFKYLRMPEFKLEGMPQLVSSH